MPRRALPVYVQISICTPLDKLWQLTQEPELHQEWDLRFSEIRYLPRPDPAQPQKFLYATRLIPGVCIRGEGDTVGMHNGANGERVSALRFRSADPRSLIREGSGYWKYIPVEGDTIHFLTCYDYAVRFGPIGRTVDRFFFRPLMGWATAWSFDRLRLWIEQDLHPRRAMRRSIVYVVMRVTATNIVMFNSWLLKQHSDLSVAKVAWLGAIAAGRSTFVWHRRWPLYVLLLTLTVMAFYRCYVIELAGLAAIAVSLVLADMFPTSNRCQRCPQMETQ